MWRDRLGEWRNGLDGKTVQGLTASALWQLARYAVPLVTFPYLARVLGVEGFGLIGLAMAILGYAGMLTDWGFSLTATQAVAQNRHDPAAVNRIIWSTLMAKAGLGLLCTAAIAVGAAFAPPALRPVLWAAIVGLLAGVLTVDWALRGAEAFGRFAATSILGRLATLPLVFLLVRDADDAAMAVLVTGLGGMVAAVLSHLAAIRMGLIGRPRSGLADAWRALRDGAHVFSSRAAVSLYSNTIVAGLALLGGTAQVGLYTAGERIRIPAHALLSPIAMVFFPRMGALSLSDPLAAERMARRLLIVEGSAALLLSLALAIAAPLVVFILLGDGFMAVVPVLRVLAALIFLVSLSNVLGLMIMLPFGMKRAFGYCILSGATVGLVAMVPLIQLHGAMGAALTAVLSEIAVVGTMLFALGRRFAWLRPGRTAA